MYKGLQHKQKEPVNNMEEKKTQWKLNRNRIIQKPTQQIQVTEDYMKKEPEMNCNDVGSAIDTRPSKSSIKSFPTKIRAKFHN